MRFRLAFIFSLLATAALAQSGVAVKQSGNVTPNQIPWWITSGVIGGGVTSADSPITSFGVTNNGLQGLCVNSDRITAAGRNTMCFGVRTAGGPAQITVTNFGTAAPLGFQYVINGATITPAGGITAITVGSTTIGSGTNNCLAYDVSGVFQCLVTANNSILATNGSGMPVYTTALPNGTTSTTQALNDSTTKIATDAFVQGQIAAGTGPIVVGTTPISGGSGQILYDNAGVLGEKQIANADVAPGAAIVPSKLAAILAGHVMANATSGSASPADTSATSWFDQAYCSTVGWLVARTTSAWVCSQGIPVNVEWFNILPGNSASTNSTNFASLLTGAGKAQFLFPHDGYSFNTSFILTVSQSITCAYRGDPTVSANLIQSATGTDLLLWRGGYITLQNCSLAVAGNPTGARGVVIGDDAVQVATGNVITSGNPTITCTSCTFTSGDVGKQFTAVGAGTSSGPLLTSISAFVDSTHVTLAATPGTSQTNTTIGYGFNYQEDQIIDSAIYNFTGAINIVAATQYHVRHVYALGPDPLSIANIIWADQGDGVITESTFVANTAGTHNTVNYTSGGGLRFFSNKILAQAAITNCFQIPWNGQSSSVGPWIIANTIEGSCSTGIAVDGTASTTANGGIIDDNEIGIVSAGTAINLSPSTAHPAWTVTHNIVRQTGGGSGIIVANMSNIILGPNAGQNTDANGSGILYNIGSAATGSVYVSSTNITNPIINNSTSMVIDDPVGLVFASLPSAAANGSRIFVTNGAPASSPCTGASTGSTAFRQNGAWKCF